jgi:hypothetical protein
MIEEHDRVVLMADRPDQGLMTGDVGTVVHIYQGGRAYEVEFVALDGETAGVVTVETKDVRTVGRHEIAHVRSLAVA